MNITFLRRCLQKCTTEHLLSFSNILQEAEKEGADFPDASDIDVLWMEVTELIEHRTQRAK